MGEKSLDELYSLRMSLVDIEKLIKNQEQLCTEDPNSFAYKLSLQSSERQKKALEGSIKEIENENNLVSLDLKLDSKDMVSGSIPIEILGNAMVGLQRIINNVAQAIHSGPTKSGPFSSEVMENAKLKLSSIYPGSFGMHIDGLRQEDMLGESLLNESIYKFKEILEIEEENMFFEQLDDLGYRTVKSYKDWLSKLESSDVSLEMKVIDEDGNRKIITKNPIEMKKIRKALENIETPEFEEVSVVGKLIGANMRSGVFEFVNGDETITGKANSIAKGKFKDYPLGNEYKAIFEKEKFINISKTIWVLIDIEET